MTDITKTGRKEAEALIEVFERPDFRDTEPLTAEECRKLGYDDDASDLLVAVLGDGVDGLVTPDELNRLRTAGFNGEFVDILAKDDGAYALNRRVAELSKYAVTRIWRPDYPAVQGHSIQELGKYGDYAEIGVPRLHELLKDCESSCGFVRRVNGCEKDYLTMAADSLGNIGRKAKSAIPSLKRAAKEWPVEKKPAAILALARIGTAEEVLGIVINEGLENNQSWALRAAACQAMGILGSDPRTITSSSFLVKIVEDEKEEPRVRREAALALGRILPHDTDDKRRNSAVLALINVLGSGDVGVRDAAHASLKAVGSFALTHLVDTLRKHGEEDAVKVGCIKVLGEIVYGLPDNSLDELTPLVVDEAIPILIQFLENGPVKNASADALVLIALRKKKETIQALSQVVMSRPFSEASEHVATAFTVIAGKAGEDDREMMDMLMDRGVPALSHALRQNGMKESALFKMAEAMGAIARKVKSKFLDLTPKFKEGAIPALSKVVRECSGELCRVAGNALNSIGRHSVSELVNLLSVVPPKNKPFVVSLLVEVGKNDEGAIPEIVDALKNAAAQQTIAEVLAGIGAPVVPYLANALTGWDHISGREYAAKALGMIGPKVSDVLAVEALVEALAGPVPVRQAASQALVNIGSLSISLLIDELEDEGGNKVVHENAAWIIGEVAPKVERSSPVYKILIERGVPVLIKALRYTNMIPDGAQKALVVIGLPAVDGMVERLGGVSASVRERLVAVMTDIDRDVAPKVIPLLLGSEHVKEAASRILVGIGPPVVPDIFRSARDWPSERLWLLADVVAEIPFSDVNDLIYYMRVEGEPGMHAVSVGALSRLKSGSIDVLVDEVEGGKKVYARIRAICVLGRIGREVGKKDTNTINKIRGKVVPVLFRLWEKNLRGIHVALSDALVDIGIPSVYYLAETVKDEQKDVSLRVEAVEMLGKIARKLVGKNEDVEVFVEMAVPALTESLKLSEDSEVRSEVINLLTSLGLPAFDKLIKAFSEGDAYVRTQIELILKQIAETDKRAHLVFVQAYRDGSVAFNSTLDHVLEEIGPADPSVLEDLLKLTRRNMPKIVRLNVIREIVRMERNAIGIIPDLQRRLEEERRWNGSREVIGALEDAVIALKVLERLRVE